jgi:hypothetical protein
MRPHLFFVSLPTQMHPSQHSLNQLKADDQGQEYHLDTQSGGLYHACRGLFQNPSFLYQAYILSAEAWWYLWSSHDSGVRVKSTASRLSLRAR